MMNASTVHIATGAAILAAPPIVRREQRPPVRRTSEHVRAEGRDVRVDIYEPDDREPHAIILILHGSAGLLVDGSLMRRIAVALAESGFRTGVVHYFNATGTFFTTAEGVEQHARIWKEVIEQMVTHYGEEAPAVGLFGYSLGGMLAIGVSEDLDQVEAIAIMSAGVPEDEEERVPSHLAPMLILYGEKNRKTAPERAQALLQLGSRAGVDVESVLYPQEGQTFGASAERDAVRRMADFFHARLEAGESS